MTTMVVVASKHGSTAEIGERIASTLNSRGVRAHVKSVDEAEAWLYETDNVVVGMPVYQQKLSSAGTLFLQSNRSELLGKPMFLFAVGGGPRLSPELTKQLKSFPHREVAYFRGAITKDRLGFLEKLQLRLMHIPMDVDYRDWVAVEDWARGLVAYGVN